MKKETWEAKMIMAARRLKANDLKLLTGSTIGKYPIILDGGRTVIFISDKSKESETREKYELRKDNKFNFLLKKRHI
ncbi:MAG: hypothetical protein Q8905_10780 [Bacteroidota bacterium]|nr:hypothetical protein [Bacteroidota bacterium]